MKTAKDLMTKNPKGIQSGLELRDVVDIFFENSITTAPVVNPVGDVMGMLSELSLIRAFLRHHLEPGKHEKVVHHQELLLQPTFIEEEASITDVIRALIKSPTHRILVLNKMSNLVGIISPKDILTFLAGEDKKALDMRLKLENTKKEIETLQKKLKNMESVVEQYKGLYDNAPNMLHSVDTKGKIVMANKKIHEILGYRPGELLRKTMFDLYDPSAHQEAAQGLKKIMDDGFHNSIYTTMLKKDGTKIRVDIASSALRGHDGEFLGTITATRVVDSDALLRALHGVIKDDELPPDKVLESLTKKVNSAQKEDINKKAMTSNGEDHDTVPISSLEGEEDI